MINTLLTINGNTISDARNLKVDRNIEEFNSTSSFSVIIDTPFGRHTEFALNQEVIIYADIDTDPAVTKIFTGVIEDINYSGEGTKEKLKLKGRDYGAILQDINTQSRVFKNQETSTIVQDIMDQNITDGITTNNIDITTTTISKITFSNISVFDSLTQLAEIAGFYFYVDEDKDLHFEQRDQVSSGVTFDNTNVLSANIRQADHEIFNRVAVHGERQLTGVRQIFTTGTDNTGSAYILTDKPHNTLVTTSGPANVVLSPGGVIDINDPSTETVKYLVDFQGRTIILTSGTTAGDNTQANGSVVVFDYQRTTPIISLQQDIISQQDYGLKDKNIIDTNVKSQAEANTKSISFLSEHKDPKIQADIDVKGVLVLTPGNTATLNLPNFNQNNEVYRIVNVSYDFNPIDNQNESVLRVTLSKKIADFIDIMKQEMLRLRSLESSQFDSNITTLETATNNVQISGVPVAINRSIGSAFYFHVDGHNILGSTTTGGASLLGDMRAGSSVLNIISTGG